MRQRLLFTWLALLLGVAGANAKEAYAYYMESDHSLNFCYDDSKATRAQNYPVYSLNTGTNTPAWNSIASQIEELYFYSSFAEYSPTSCYKWAYGMTNLTRVRNISNLNTSNVTNMGYMFHICNKLTSLDVSGFNTSKVTNMQSMFRGCIGLKSLNLSKFNTSNVINMANMFHNCAGLTSLNVSNFNTANVTDMSYMFYNCQGLTSLDLSNFNIAKVQNSNLSYFFNNCYALKSLKLSSSLASSTLIDSDACSGVGTASSPCVLYYPTSVHLTSSFTTITPDYVVWKEGYFKSNNMHAYAVFNDSKLTFWYDDWYNTIGTNYDLNTGSNDPAWYSNAKNITSVSFSSSFMNARPTSCYSWFYGMYNLNSISGMESNLNTSKVTTMQYMFYGCKLLKSINTSNFNTNNVTSMNGMFMECRALTNVNVSSFNTSKVTDMTYMFDGCNNLASLDLSNFDMSKLTSSNGMMRFCSKLSTLTIPSTANKLATNACLGIGYTDQPCKLVYPSGFTPKEQDSGEGWYKWKSGYFYDEMINAYAFLSSDGKTLTFYYDANRFSRTGGTAYSLDYGSYINEKPAWYSKRAGVTKVVFNSTFANARPDQCDSWFEGMSNLTTITGLNYLDTYETGSMDYMFKNCTKLTSIDLSHLNTYNLATINYMFAGCTSLKSVKLNGPEFPLSEDMINQIMNGVFDGCSSLTSLDLSDFYFEEPYTYTYGDTSYEAYTITIKTGNNLLRGCTSLQELVLPATANNLSDDAFEGVGTTATPCFLSYPTGFSVNAEDVEATGSGWYKWKGGYFIDSNMTTAYAWLSSDGKTLTFYYDKNRFSRTGGTAYSLDYNEKPAWYDKRTGVTKVVFNSSFANARPEECDSWFEGMSNLTTITGLSYLNTSEVILMSRMFKGCSKLTTLDLSTFDTSWVYRMDNMFEGCSSLTSVNVSSFNTSRILDMEEIYGAFGQMFKGCSSLTSLDISNFIIPEPYRIELEDAEMWEQFTSEYIKNGYGYFYACSHMLEGCTALRTLTVPASAANMDLHACDNVGTKTSPCTLVYPSGFTPQKDATGDGWYQWKGGYFCDPVFGIQFADNTVKGICLSNWDSNGDGQLTEAEAAAVTSVGTVFKSALITTFDEFKYFMGVTSLSDGAFSKSTLTAITLPSTLKTIGNEAFLECKSLKSITIPAMVTSIGQNALSYCTAMTSITVKSGNTAFASISGVLFTKDKKTLLQFPAAKTTAYSVPSGTTTIGRDAFFMSSLKSVTLPSSLRELAYDAFGYSKSLTNVELPKGLTTIGDYAFDGCSSLKTLSLPATVTSIGKYMCNGCKAITDVYNASKTPFSIADNNFTSTTYSNATLHVPAGKKATYAALGGWKKFTKVSDDLPGGNLGDANGDGEVTVNDVQMVVEYVLGKNPSGIVLANCDVTGDNEVSINDVNAIVSMVLNGPAAIAPNARESLTDMVALTARGSHCSLHLDNSEPYHAFQLELVLPEGGSMGNVTLAEGRSNGHHAEWSEVMPGRYNVVVYATNGEALRDGSTTALMHFDIAGCKADDVSVEGIQMIDGWCKTVLLPSTSGVATGISWVVDDASEGSSSPYYNTVGVGSNTPQRGVNIKDGRKVVKK